VATEEIAASGVDALRDPAPARSTPRRIIALLIEARPYSWLWSDIAPLAAMGLWLAGPHPPVWDLLGVIAALVLTEGAMTTLNDICDIDTDRASSEPDRNRRPLAAGIVPVSWAYAQVAVMSVLALAVGFVTSVALGVLILGGIAWGFAYSARPVGLSGRPYISHAAWCLLLMGMYVGVWVSVGGELERGWLFLVGSIAFLAFGETLAKDLRDLDNDAATGRRTTPVAIGPRRAARGALAAYVVASIAWIASAVLADDVNWGLVIALTGALGLWLWRAAEFTSRLAAAWDKSVAVALHSSVLRMYLTVNLMFIAGLAS
jgi:4-hydroxybenzoate polyprenyltransferase